MRLDSITERRVQITNSSIYSVRLSSTFSDQVRSSLVDSALSDIQAIQLRECKRKTCIFDSPNMIILE